MLAVTKMITLVSFGNFILIGVATYAPNYLQLEPDDGTSWIQLLASVCTVFEMVSMYMLSKSKIDDYHVVYIKLKMATSDKDKR